MNLQALKVSHEYFKNNYMDDDGLGASVFAECVNDIFQYLITNHKSEYPKLPIEEPREPNPFPFPSKEDYITLFDFRVKCGNALSDTFLRQAFQKFPEFFKTCGAKYGVKNHIQFNRALHWLWDNGSFTVRNKLIKHVNASNKAKFDAFKDKVNKAA